MVVLRIQTLPSARAQESQLVPHGGRGAAGSVAAEAAPGGGGCRGRGGRRGLATFDHHHPAGMAGSSAFVVVRLDGMLDVLLRRDGVGLRGETDVEGLEGVGLGLAVGAVVFS